MTKRTRSSFLRREPEKRYHAQAKKFLSSHQLADFRKCPLLYRRKKLGLIPDQDRPAYLVGRAAHTSILEGPKAFSKTYAVGGPINEKTGEVYGSRTKAYQEWAAKQGKPVLTDEQAALVVRMAEGVRSHDAAMKLLATGVAEGVARAKYRGVRSQIRIDWLNPDRGIIDLKTCDNLDYFESDARRYGYVHQLAFYRTVLQMVSGERFGVHLIAIEKREPFRCGAWRLGQDVLGICERENDQAIESLKRCEQIDVWRTGYEAIREFDWI